MEEEVPTEKVEVPPAPLSQSWKKKFPPKKKCLGGLRTSRGRKSSCRRRSATSTFRTSREESSRRRSRSASGALEPVVEEEVSVEEEEVPPAPLEPVVEEKVPAEEEKPSLNNNVNEFKSDDIEDELPDESKKNLFKPIQESKAPTSPRPPIRPRFSPPPYNRQNSTIYNTSNHVEESKTLIGLRQFRSNIVSTWRYVKDALTHNPTK